MLPDSNTASDEMAALRELVPFPSRAGQFVLVLLHALRALMREERIVPQCQTVFAFIQAERLLNLQIEDLEPYPSTELNGGKEPRWHNMLRWSRDYCVEFGLIENDEKGVWRPTKSGLNDVILARALFQQKVWNVRQAFFWSPHLKSQFDPAYSQSSLDSPRPRFVYEDKLPDWRKSVRGVKENTPPLVDFSEFL